MNAKATLLFLLIVYCSTLSVAFADACGEYTAGRVTERTASDRQDYQVFFTAGQDLLATGDFDGDSRVDKAFFTRTGDGYVLVACLHDGKQAVIIRDLTSVAGLGITTSSPGIYLSACATGYGRSPCRPGRIVEVELDHEGIHFINYEKAAFLAYWKNGKFRRLYTSD